MSRRTKTLLPTSGRLLRRPEFDTTFQLLHAQRNKQAFYYNNGTKELRPLEPGNTVRILPPNIVNNGPQQGLTNKLVYAHTKLSLTTEGCITGNADTCVSQLKPLNNHLLTWRYVPPNLVPCPLPKLIRYHQ